MNPLHVGVVGKMIEIILDPTSSVGLNLDQGTKCTSWPKPNPFKNQ